MKRLWLMLALLPVAALAHEGHEHADPAAAPVAVSPGGLTDPPRRLADGRVQVAKASQHLWRLRTLVARETEVSAGVELAGRVVADPSAGGPVQAPFAGIVEAGPAGLPLPGQAVKAGQVLAWLRPTLPPLERSARVAARAELETRLGIARQRAARLARLEGSVAAKDIDAARAEADGLARQLAALGTALNGREALRAPVAGVVAAAQASVGQQVEAGAELFEVLRPDRLMVEAVAYDPALLASVAGARGEAGEVALKLRPAGAGRRLREGTLPLLFRVEAAPPLAVGQPVKVFVQLRGPVARALVLPREAVEGVGDEARVWVHEAPERFAPRPVRVSPVDAGRLRVLGGLGAGERVVVQGAHLLGSVR